MRRWVRIAAVLVVVLVFAFFLAAPGIVENRYNHTLQAPPYKVSDRARALHGQLVIADLHADPLLWGRDLRNRSRRGHTDIPRLREGNVAIQGFGVVTRAPAKQSIQSNEDSSDMILRLALVQMWPPRTYNSLMERALYQAQRLEGMEGFDSSQVPFEILRTRGDLQRVLDARRQNGAHIGGFLAIEGAQALEGEVTNLERLHAAGYRMIGLAHFVDNSFAGSAHGVKKHGLTDAGRELVRRMEASGIAVDLAHASAATIDDVLAIVHKPVVVSHTGVRGTCDNQRNLSDDQLRRIAATGGVVGIGFWDTAVCGMDARAIARAMRHAAHVMGVAHVGLGSDFDGAVTTPFDATGLIVLTDALLTEGFSESEVAAIMGGNVIRVLGQTLPE
jgi:membrane dipeptidase